MYYSLYVQAEGTFHMYIKFLIELFSILYFQLNS